MSGPITVTIFDAGPERLKLRYSAEAALVDDDGCHLKTPRSKPRETVSEALECVHWRDIGVTPMAEVDVLEGR